MIVKFLKTYQHTFKTFKKGDVARLDHQLSAKLLGKGIVEEFGGVMKNDIELKKVKQGK